MLRTGILGERALLHLKDRTVIEIGFFHVCVTVCVRVHMHVCKCMHMYTYAYACVCVCNVAGFLPFSLICFPRS